MKEKKIVINDKLSKQYVADVTVFCISQKEKDVPLLPDELKKSDFGRAAELGDFKGNENDVMISYAPDTSKKIRSKRVAMVGVGSISKNIDKVELVEKMRVAGGNIASLVKKAMAEKICVVLPEMTGKASQKKAVRGLTEGIILGEYTFTKYKTDEEDKKKTKDIKEIRFLAKQNLSSLRLEAGQAHIDALSACHARDMANEPGNGWNAESFARYGRELAAKYDLHCTVFDKKELTKMNMGGILAVNRGSETPPQMVVVEYRAAKKAPTVLLVGKGLTFDSGGISIKPAAGMEDMKYDMCGGAAVLAAMNIVGAEKPKCNVIAIVPATDNMSGGSAVKPGDIIQHYNKTTSEVINTDAEGRLILADALAYGIERYQPDYVVDLATLTGAVITGLGHHHTGLLANDDELARKLTEAGRECGEPLWRLPLGKEYRKQLDSKVADIKNTGGKAGGTITAAEYLHSFVGDTPWAHLDIAGTAWGFTEKSYIPEGGPSGMCVRTLAAFLRRL